MSLKDGLEDRIKGLALEGVDIIFIKEPHLYDRMKRINVSNVTKPIQVIMVREFDDLKALSHVDMRALGWVRAKKLSAEDAVKVLEEKGFDVEMDANDSVQQLARPGDSG